MSKIYTEAPTTPSGLAYTGNPIVIADPAEVVSQQLAGYPFTVDMGGRRVYEGRFHHPYSVDVSGIVDAFAPDLPGFGYGPMLDCGFVCEIEGPEEFARRTTYIHFDGETEREYGFVAMRGGVSASNRRCLALTPGEDIFTARFLAKDTCFFMTARTSGWRLNIKETELRPLVFVTDTEDETITAVEKTTGQSLTADGFGPGVYALDVDALRRRFFEEKGVLPSVFDIYRRGSMACRIAVTRAEVSADRCRLMFRNSFGAFETIELTGKVTCSPGWDSAEEAACKSYDLLTGEYITERGRTAMSSKLTVDTGFKTPGEIRLMLDMVGSDNVQLVGLLPRAVRVIPSIEEPGHSLRQDAPESFTLLLDMSEDGMFVTPDFAGPSDMRRPRVFSPHFDGRFN
ncbi:MAG: hypothetical protein K2H87_04945 [Duncaniella sp.]|nr:hypothetical protein [Duncaniella sp.]